MNPTPVVPPVTSWLMSPYVLGSFGAVVALGFVIFVLVYIIFFKLKPGMFGVPPASAINGGSRLLPCWEHSGMVARVVALEEWRKQHDVDYRDILKELRLIPQNLQASLANLEIVREKLIEIDAKLKVSE